MITIREYRPGFVDMSEELREAKVDDESSIETIPWLKAKGTVEIKGDYILHKPTRFIIAIIIR